MKLLTIDRNPGVQRLLEDLASADGWQMKTTSSLEGSIEILGGYKPDLILVDFQTCDHRDRQFILELRAHARAALILLVDQERLGVLSGAVLSGCEDFICKPILAAELTTRMQKLLRRNGDDCLEYGSIHIDQRNKQVKIAEQRISMTPKEYRLLELLVQGQGRVFSSQEIIKCAWAGSSRASATDVQQYIHHLRQKMKASIGDHQCIRNDKGFGYHLDCQECANVCGNKRADQTIDTGGDGTGDGHPGVQSRSAPGHRTSG